MPKIELDAIDIRILNELQADGVVLMSNYHGTYLGDPALEVHAFAGAGVQLRAVQRGELRHRPAGQSAPPVCRVLYPGRPDPDASGH